MTQNTIEAVSHGPWVRCLKQFNLKYLGKINLQKINFDVSPVILRNQKLFGHQTLYNGLDLGRFHEKICFIGG